MDRGIVLELIPTQSSDFEKVVVDHANGRLVDLSAYRIALHSSPIDGFRPEFLVYIRAYGLTSYLRRHLVTEEVIAPGTAKNDVQDLVKNYVDGLSIDRDLLIIDPYFFAPTKDQDYPEFFVGILDAVLSKLETLHVVTLPGGKVDQQLVHAIEGKLRGVNPNVQLIHRTSDRFHDRFWINRTETKGFITGTSLNGLGKRYALVDHLQRKDVESVISAAEAEGLIPN